MRKGIKVMVDGFRFSRALLKLINPKTWGVFTEIAEISRFDSAVSLSWSQGGEDLALLNLFSNQLGNYIDVGCHHPSRFSITRHLYQRGWSGVNIDANSALIPLFNKSRKRDVNLWKAVGSKSQYQLTVFNEPAISTINENWRNKFISENNAVSHIEEVPGVTLREILDKYFASKHCSLLAIDIEGADFDALQTVDFETLSKDKYPDWILLETFPPVSDALHTDSVRYALNYGYIPYLVLSMSTLLKKEN
jgi:FkbM family methyltransferase